MTNLMKSCGCGFQVRRVKNIPIAEPLIPSLKIAEKLDMSNFKNIKWLAS